MHPSTAQALEAIDAAIFSGDMLYVDAELAELKDYLDRWGRAVTGAEEARGEPAASAPSKTKHTPSTKLVSFTVGGNLHEVASYLNKFGLSEFLVLADSGGGSSTVLLRMPIDWPCDRLGPKPATAT